VTIFGLKIIACITMILDHVKYAFPILTNKLTLFCGRIAFPLFAFCAVEGYVHTSDFNKYVKRLLIAAFLSQISFSLFCSLPLLDPKVLNIIFTIFLGVMGLKLFEKTDLKILKIFVFLGISFLGEILNVDYKFYGVAMIFMFYIFRESKIKKAISFLILVTIRYLYLNYKFNLGFSQYVITLWLGTLTPIIFILLYNGERGIKNQKFYYWFYPIHLLLLYLISPYTYYKFISLIVTR